MQSREEAITWFVEQGFFAKARDWSLGNSICIWSSQEIEPSTGITICHNLVYLYPEMGKWHLLDPSAQFSKASYSSLYLAAVGVVNSLTLKSGK